MKVNMIAGRKAFRYGSRMLMPGASFVAPRGDARVLEAARLATRDDQTGPVVPAVTPAPKRSRARAPAAELPPIPPAPMPAELPPIPPAAVDTPLPVPPDLERLRVEYQLASGEAPDGRWGAARLREAIQALGKRDAE